ILGRLNRHNFAEPLIHAVPNAVHPHYAALQRTPSGNHDDFPVLWSGGFNTWTDVEMLVEGFAEAMAEHPRLRLVCTGGPVLGHDESTYSRFEAMVKEK